MLIATLLSQPQLVRLSDAADDLFAVMAPARDWAHLHELLRDRPLSLVVVDPLVGKSVAASEVVRILKYWPSTPIIAYTNLTPDTARILALLGRQGLRDVIFYQLDDARLRLSRKLRRAAASRITERLRIGLYARLSALPTHIAATVEDLLERPYAFQAGADLATASGEPKRSLLRALDRVGLASPRQLLLAARVAYAATYLRDPGLKINDVAIKLGYARSDVLVRHTMEVLGVRPARLRTRGTEHYSEEALIERLLQWTQRPVTHDT